MKISKLQFSFQIQIFKTKRNLKEGVVWEFWMEEKEVFVSYLELGDKWKGEI